MMLKLNNVQRLLLSAMFDAACKRQLECWSVCKDLTPSQDAEYLALAEQFHVASLEAYELAKMTARSNPETQEDSDPVTTLDDWAASLEGYDFGFKLNTGDPQYVASLSTARSRVLETIELLKVAS